MDVVNLLSLLADGKFHSGEELGNCLGVSRTAVWKHLRKLDDLGLSLESVKGKGYRLVGGLELLDSEYIKEALDPRARGLLKAVDVHFITDSTNTQAMNQAMQSEASGYVCLAEQQTSGKGRRGRPWVSPFGRNIYMSLVWGFDGGAESLQGLSLAVGVAVVRALEGQGVSGLQLKWPNDIQWRGRKLAGILLEMTGDVSDYCQVVVGLGVNVSMSQVAVEGIDQDWVDIETIMAEQGIGKQAESNNSKLNRNLVVASILNQLLPLLSEFQVRGFAAWQEAWQALDAFYGQAVTLRSVTRVVEGIARGVSCSGALKVESHGKEELFSGGEISLRPKT